MNVIQVSRVPANPYVMVTVEIHSEAFMKLLQGSNKKAEAAVGKDFLTALAKHIEQHHTPHDVEEKVEEEEVQEQ